MRHLAVTLFSAAMFVACQPELTRPCPAEAELEAAEANGGVGAGNTTGEHPGETIGGDPPDKGASQGPKPSFTVVCPESVEFEEPKPVQAKIPDDWAQWPAAIGPAATFKALNVAFVSKLERWRIICRYEHPALAAPIRLKKRNQNTPNLGGVTARKCAKDTVDPRKVNCWD